MIVVRVLLVLFLFAAPSLAAEGERRAITFCLASHNMPMSGGTAPLPGYEHDVAAAIAEALGAAMYVEWTVPSPGELERALLDGRCDAVPGALAESATLAASVGHDEIALTRPYYGTGYFVVRRAAAEPLATLAALGDRRIAVEAESVVVYTLRQRRHGVFVVYDHAALLNAVASEQAAYGYAWGPVAAWTLRKRDDLVVAPEFAPSDRWDFSIAVRASDESLREEIDGAIGALVARGDVRRIMERYEMAWLPVREPID